MALLLLVAVVTALLLPALFRFASCLAEVARAHWVARHIPGPPAYPLVGHLLLLLSVWSDLRTGILSLRHKYGGVFRLWIADRITIVVMNPEDLEVVCTHPALASKARQYSVLEAHMGKGLITMNSDPDYKRHRKAITPSLHLDILQDFVPTFVKHIDMLTKTLEDLADGGGTVDLRPILGKMANASITETVLSTHLSSQSEELWDTIQALDKASSLMMWRSLRPWWESDLLFRLSSKYGEFKQSAATMQRAVIRILQQKMDDVSQGMLPPPRKRMAFLDHVLRSVEGGTITRNELNDELKTLLFAGSSTSVDFLSLVAVILALHPEVQRKIQEELDAVFGEDRTRAVQPDDLPHLQYLECALKEVLRYAPPAPMFFRHATEDVKLPSGYVIPRGASVALVPAGTHRDPRYFPDPERFDPDRFLPENTRGRHPFAFIPFSAGARNCIGQRYAMMFAKTAMATVLRRVSFLPAPEGPACLDQLQVELGVTMSIKGGTLVRLQRKAGSSSATL